MQETFAEGLATQPARQRMLPVGASLYDASARMWLAELRSRSSRYQQEERLHSPYDQWFVEESFSQMRIHHSVTLAGPTHGSASATEADVSGNGTFGDGAIFEGENFLTPLAVADPPGTSIKYQSGMFGCVRPTLLALWIRIVPACRARR